MLVPYLRGEPICPVAFLPKMLRAFQHPVEIRRLVRIEERCEKVKSGKQPLPATRGRGFEISQS